MVLRRHHGLTFHSWPAVVSPYRPHCRYYYRSSLDAADPVTDLAERIQWASHRYKTPGRPLFLLVFGGLGLYGGHKDLFTFLQSVISRLAADDGQQTYTAIGAQEMARMAVQQWL